MLRASLKVVGGKHDGQLIPLSMPKFLIGREEDCHLRPNSDMISRHHCAFTVDDFSVRLRDLGSTNGTLVNGVRIRGVVQLHESDRVVVGKLEFQVVIDEETSTVPDESTPSTVLQGETVELSSEETHYEIPAVKVPDPESETTIVAKEEIEAPVPTPSVPTPSEQPTPAQLQPQAVTEQPPASPAPAPQPAAPQPAAPQPPPGFPYPQQQPMGYPYPMGYPPAAGGYFPQYPQYPYPQPVVMGQPVPPQGAAAPPPPGPATPPPGGSQSSPEIRLPDPSTTGLEEQPTAKEGGSSSSDEKNPSEHAADIIRDHMHRRPTVEE